MNEETKEEIQAVLLLLRDTLVRNGVSIGLEFREKEILFFDTKTYLKEKRFSGFTVKTDSLVK